MTMNLKQIRELPKSEQAEALHNYYTTLLVRKTTAGKVLANTVKYAEQGARLQAKLWEQCGFFLNPAGGFYWEIEDHGQRIMVSPTEITEGLKDMSLLVDRLNGRMPVSRRA